MNINIFVVVNKWWEAVPLVAALQHGNPRQSGYSAAPSDLVAVSQQGLGMGSLASPRLTFDYNAAQVEIWCIQDLIAPTANSSSTWEKVRVLPRVIRDSRRASLIIAFGTAACPQGSGQNGTVVIGSSVFLHDPYCNPPDPEQHWSDPRFNQIVVSDAQSLLAALPGDFSKEAEKRLLTPPNGGAAPPHVITDPALVAVSVVNVTKSADYVWTDKQALEKFKGVSGSTSTQSLETTHGVIRLVLDAPFLYISGLANAVGQFPDQVLPNPYSQNFVAAHNAAIALAWLLPNVVRLLNAH